MRPIDSACSAVFVLEAVIKVVAEGAQPLHYFHDPWYLVPEAWCAFVTSRLMATMQTRNRFDALVVVTTTTPEVLRLARIQFRATSTLSLILLLRLLRIVKMIRFSSQLRLIVTAILNGLASMGYISCLIALVIVSP